MTRRKKENNIPKTIAHNIGLQFIQHFYTSINNNQLINLQKLYKVHTTWKVQGELIKGPEKIGAKLQSFIQNKIKYNPLTADITDSGARRLNILVTGNIQIMENNIYKTYKFTEYFLLAQDNTKNFWIHNSIFRLIM